MQDLTPLEEVEVAELEVEAGGQGRAVERLREQRVRLGRRHEAGPRVAAVLAGRRKRERRHTAWYVRAAGCDVAEMPAPADHGAVGKEGVVARCVCEPPVEPCIAEALDARRGRTQRQPR